MSPLAPLQLDDVGFRELAEAAIERIPAESGGRWTLHAPVDPGITLLELLAYLLDQRIWWLDQVSDSAVRAMLRLLGESPQRARPASTVLQIDPASAAPATQVPPGVHMVVQASDPEIAFTTGARLLLLPVFGVGLFTGGQSRSEDLERGSGVELLPADGGPGEARLVLRTDGPLPAAGDGSRAGLLLRLRTQTLGSEWLAEEDDPRVPPPAELIWGYGDKTFPPGAVLDGTGGLRRSGIVRFDVPADWSPDQAPDAQGRAEYSLWVRTERATFTAPPRLVAAIPNAVVARHTARVRVPAAALEEQVRNWLPLPGCVLDCGAPGLVMDNPRATRLSLRERDGRWRRWRPTQDLAFHGPADRVYVVNREAGTLEFGDGVTGRVPVLHHQAPRARLSFVAGAGPSGNFGTVAWEARRGTLTARGVAEAAGGRDPETIAAARERVGAALARRERAITADDHRSIAESTPGVEVKRAHAAVGFHPGHPCTLVPGAVTVFVVPDAPGGELGESEHVAAPVPDPGLLAAVAARLEAARLLGSELFVEPPRYRHVRLLVTVSTPAPDEQLRQAIEADLREYLDPLTGGDDRDGWPFGEPLRPSALLRRAQAVAGSSAQIASVAAGVDGAEPDRRCEDIAIGPHDLVVADAVDLRGDVPVDVEGGLR